MKVLHVLKWLLTPPTVKADLKRVQTMGQECVNSEAQKEAVRSQLATVEARINLITMRTPK